MGRKHSDFASKIAKFVENYHLFEYMDKNEIGNVHFTIECDCVLTSSGQVRMRKVKVIRLGP